METVAAFAEIAEAQLIRSVLEGHGISAVIPNEQTAEIAPPYLWGSGGVKVQVAAEDLAIAREVLATLEKDGPAAAAAESNPDV
ncbi:putative signal transducing protein [Synoicihabitans lomoniglobus]|uniref:DUF2007 domain-containing protein n=1 Tax=Synoicihabitans lomoniglobus TaxID=2909285 RepID=A0AAF0CNF4_9BACT|nr:DUF2007 domain-containing protein [Opitutaceae bacterium LMO-M01]WED64491.1 DUF2007 domain-containing protein [Opitutaceae bacterium LMO-M01]